MANEKSKRNRYYIGIVIFFVAIVMFLSPFLPVVNSGTFQSVITSSHGALTFNYNAYVNITKYDRDIYENRIIENAYYLGPNTVFLNMSNGYFMGFIRQGASHAGVGDYGKLTTYMSLDNGVTWYWTNNLVGITNRDVRNFACGESQTNRLFIFYSIYDVNNDTTQTEEPYYNYSAMDMEYLYTDNCAWSWSERIPFVMPEIDLLYPVGGSAYGTLRQIGDGKIGFSYYCWNTANDTQARFAYSDDDGLTWNHSLIFESQPQFAMSETDIVYVGNNQLIALSRVEEDDGPIMFTSIDNGVTWTDRGSVNFRFSGSTMPQMALTYDDKGMPWVFALFFQSTNVMDYSFGEAYDLINTGPTAWNENVDCRENGIDVGGSPIIDMSSDHIGYIMTSQEDSPTTAFVSLYNLTMVITQWEVESIWYGFVWLFIVFIPPIAMSEIIGKLGYSFGMIIILCVLAGSQANFLPIAMIGITAVGITTYKER